MRKHYTQLSNEEYKRVLNSVRSFTPSLHPHVLIRMRQKSITESQILASITYGSIVEVHNDNPGEIRVLVRGKVMGKFLCSVVSLTKKQVITAYWNKAGDNHQTIDMTPYTWTQNLLDLL